MLCPAVGLEHSKKVRELLYRRILRAWGHNTKQTQIEVDLQNRYVKAAESITDCLVDTIYPGTYIYGDTAANRPVTGAEMGGTIFTFGNLGWWTIRIAISNDLRLFIALHTIGVSYGDWKEI